MTCNCSIDETGRSISMCSYHEDLFKKNYYRGMRTGLTMFAHWKDGEQFVGTCGTRLKDALETYIPKEKP